MKANRKISETFPVMEVTLNKKKVETLSVIVLLQIPKRIHSLVKKIQKAYKSKFEKSMTAVTFAEAGEFDLAKDILSNEKI